MRGIKRFCALLTIGGVAAASAQERGAPLPAGEGTARSRWLERSRGEASERYGLEPDRDTFLVRLIASPKASEELGISAEQSERLRNGLREIDVEQIDLQAEIQKLSLRQADLTAGLLSDRKKDSREVMELVEKLGAVKIKVAKLPIKRMLFLRDNLSDEQIANARNLMQERLGRMRRGEDGTEKAAERPGGQRPPAGGGERPR